MKLERGKCLCGKELDSENRPFSVWQVDRKGNKGSLTNDQRENYNLFLENKMCTSCADILSEKGVPVISLGEIFARYFLGKIKLGVEKATGGNPEIDRCPCGTKLQEDYSRRYVLNTEQRDVFLPLQRQIRSAVSTPGLVFCAHCANRSFQLGTPLISEKKLEEKRKRALGIMTVEDHLPEEKVRRLRAV